MLKIGITGGTGFIGRHLTALLVDKGHDVVVFTRSAAGRTTDKVTYAHWDPEKNTCDINALAGLDAVVNLAGAGIADKRLTEKRKKEIIDSRVNSTEFLLSNLKGHAPACKTFVSASAIGFYGPDKDGGKPFTEDAAPYSDFLATTCRLWEAASQKATTFLRTVIIRTGVVLGNDGGAYPKFAGPLSFGVMPVPGSGRQIVSWIVIDDLARLYLYALEHGEMSGIYNGVAPVPVTYSQLMQAIKKAHGGFALPVPVPAFALKLVLGEMSGEVLKSCMVSAEKTLKAGFKFNYPGIAGAIKCLN